MNRSRVVEFVVRLAPAMLVTAALAGLPTAAPSQEPDHSRPNVIVFVGDDLGWRDTGPYGNRFIRTPNIDRLARSGLRIEYAFGTTPQCSPSRISTLTGRYAHAVGAEDLHTPLPEGERILPSLLQERGYFTGHMAKTHYGPNAERQFQWYSPTIAEAFPAFLDSTGNRPCDEHQRAVRTSRFKLIRTDAYTELPLCTAADIGGSPSFEALRARARAGRLTPAQRRVFEAPRARVELYDLSADPWELRNVADMPAYANTVRELAGVLQEWMEQSSDFPAAYRVRDDNTDRITGVPFTSKVPPLRNADVPPPGERWGRQGPT